MPDGVGVGAVPTASIPVLALYLDMDAQTFGGCGWFPSVVYPRLTSQPAAIMTIETTEYPDNGW